MNAIDRYKERRKNRILSRMDAEPDSWITVNGNHIPIDADKKPIGGQMKAFGGAEEPRGEKNKQRKKYSGALQAEDAYENFFNERHSKREEIDFREEFYENADDEAIERALTMEMEFFKVDSPSEEEKEHLEFVAHNLAVNANRAGAYNKLKAIYKKEVGGDFEKQYPKASPKRDPITKGKKLYDAIVASDQFISEGDVRYWEKMGWFSHREARVVRQYAIARDKIRDIFDNGAKATRAGYDLSQEMVDARTPKEVDEIFKRVKKAHDKGEISSREWDTFKTYAPDLSESIDRMRRKSY